MNIFSSIRNVLGRPPADYGFVGKYLSWESATAACNGYDKPSVLDQIVPAARDARDKKVAFERDGVGFPKHEFYWPLVSVLTLAAKLEPGKVSVIDFGGSLASQYYQTRNLHRLLDIRSWTIVEQDTMLR